MVPSHCQGLCMANWLVFPLRTSHPVPGQNCSPSGRKYWSCCNALSKDLHHGSDGKWEGPFNSTLQLLQYLHPLLYYRGTELGIPSCHVALVFCTPS